MTPESSGAMPPIDGVHGLAMRQASEPLPPVPTGWLFRRVPALESLRQYSWNALGIDLMAGLTVATIAVPQAMAYAILAGVPPQYGLYTAIVMTAVGALFDSSRQLINGPTNAISIALLSALVLVPAEERISAAVTLAFMVGAIQIGIALLHLGDLNHYVSHSVIVGFTIGASTLLVLDQMKNFLGLESKGTAADHFLKRFWLTVTEGGGAHWLTVLIGAGTIAVVVAVRRINSVRQKRGARFPIPQHLVAVVIMAALVWGFKLDRHGVKIVGPIPADLPSFQFPDLKWERIQTQVGSAFAIAVLGLLEAMAMAKAIARHTGQKLDMNQQCLSEGAANMSGSFFQCMPGSGSLTRSAVNQQAGAVSQWSGVFSAIAVAGTVLLFAPLAKFIPKASLAGLLMLAAYRMVDRGQLVFHLRATRSDASVVLITALSAVLISIEFCVVIGVFLSFALYVPRAARVRMSQLSPDLHEPQSDRILVFDLEGELFFGAEAELQKHFSTIDRAARGQVEMIVLVLNRARNPDAAFLSLLKAFQQRMHSRNIAVTLSGVEADMMAALTATGLDGVINVRRA
jgi:sulfate permease, SulP family